MFRITLLLAFLYLGTSFAQQTPGKILFIPDIQGYKTLKCDFHMHTVFSDGEVWPTVRVEEAWQEGLDAIAITDHIEYTPHSKDVAPDLSRPYELAKSAADRYGIILIRSLEITRPMPPGHLNALFLTAPDSLNKKEYIDALKAARAQNAFVFWNHPGWISQAPDGIKWYDVHTELLQQGLFQGIEVVNDRSFYPEALDWALEKKLTILGNSDVHRTTGSYLLSEESGHRPVTLVFSRERTAEGIREALNMHRTAVWFKKMIIGPAVILEQLFRNAVRLDIVEQNPKIRLIKINNISDIDLSLKLKGTERNLSLPARSSIIVQTKPGSKSLDLEVVNFITGKDKFLSASLVIPL